MQQFPGVAEPAQNIHEVHDTIVSGVYTTIRLVNRAVGQTLEHALVALENNGPVERRVETTSTAPEIRETDRD